ncbi:hypothetical protein EVAR_50734_1 [Eumeta japonica]|uniref:Uncharacterized protein n=1 Tax=Eumeta variegata TaxID=151549 RepID=A0A4C1YQL2_EUMVA|nr:hypothetical protein EVAR_50734_1 [Eumeta japonica]
MSSERRPRNDYGATVDQLGRAPPPAPHRPQSLNYRFYEIEKSYVWLHKQHDSAWNVGGKLVLQNKTVTVHGAACLAFVLSRRRGCGFVSFHGNVYCAPNGEVNRLRTDISRYRVQFATRTTPVRAAAPAPAATSVTSPTFFRVGSHRVNPNFQSSGGRRDICKELTRDAARRADPATRGAAPSSRSP